MKILLLLVPVVAVFYLRMPISTYAQSLDDPKANFEPLEFDAEIRGTYNMSYCVKAKLNCWEVVKVDALCHKDRYYPTVCDIINEYCSVAYDDLADYGTPMQAVEGWCDEYWLYTK